MYYKMPLACADRVESGSNVAVHKTSISEKRSLVSYSCIPFNDHGSGPTATITVTVHFKFVSQS